MLGVMGLSCLVYCLALSLMMAWKNGQLLGILFALIVGLGMLVEDTLDAQAGITFFVFFGMWYYFEASTMSSFHDKH